MNRLLWRLRQTALEGGGPVSDGQLLERYVQHRDEIAFEALVRRHGTMVLGVCRRILRDQHEAEDAFQATFLVLVRKASAIRPREQVGNWLYGVARRTALKSRSRRLRRQSLEKPVGQLATAAAPDDPSHELSRLIDQELQHLPSKYRQPLLLCDLEGRSRKEVARRLGWPEGTVATRLARARELLARRLSRHGLPFSAAALAAALAQQARAVPLSASLIQATVKSAALFSSKHLASGTITVENTDLAQEILKMMFLHKLKMSAAVLFTLAVLGLGVVLLNSTMPGPAPADGDGARFVEVPLAQGEQKEGKGGKPVSDNNSQATKPEAKQLGEKIKPSEKKDPAELKDLILPHPDGTPAIWSQELLEFTLDKTAVTVDFKNMPLSDVLDYFREKYELNIIPDEKIIHYDHPVTLSFRFVALKAALKQTLRQVGFSYEMEDGIIVVKRDGKRVYETYRHIHPVGDLLGEDHSAKDLIRVLTKTIAPESWTETGGKGVIEYFPVTKSLIVYQTTDIQDEIMDLLGKLHQVKKAQDK